MKNKKFQGLVGLALIASLVNPLPWFENVNLLDSVKVLAAEEDTPPEDIEEPDARELQVLNQLDAKLSEFEEYLNANNTEEAQYFLEDEKENIERWLTATSKTARGQASAKRWNSLLARHNGTGDVTPKPVITTKDVTTTVDIDFTTTRVASVTMEEGKEVITTPGVKGVRTIIYTVTYTDGVETNRTEKSNVVTKEPVNQVVTYGTKKPEVTPTVTTTEETKTEVVPFTEIRENDPNLEAGKEVVATEGKNGVRTIVYTVTKKNGTETGRVVKSDTITTPAVNKVIKVGTKKTAVPVVTTEEVSETKSVPFETIRENDPNLEAGKEVVATEGKNGVRTIVYTVTKKDGTETGRVVKSDTITTPAVNKVIKVGTKKPVVPVVTTEEVSETKSVPFETIRENDPNLEAGKEVVAIEGKEGVRTIVYTVTRTDGVETSRVVKSDTITTPAVNKVIKVGTKTTTSPVVTTEEVSETKPVPFETIREEDPNLEAGKEVVAAEGKEGVRTIVYTVTKTDGVETSRVVKSDTITTPAVNKVIKVGTKTTTSPVVTTEEVSETKPVPFETIRENDPNLEAGKEVVAAEGKEGVRTIVYTVTKIDGVETGRVVKSDTITTPAVNKVIKVGTKRSVATPVATAKENKSKTENKNKTKVVDGKVLPETGEQSSGLAVIGLTLLVGLLTFVKNKRKKS
ncbi:G5 domain-containing protein [Streptococcus ruminantium]|uniref:G5 domain-containing protein n=1 Tax=Streptococcus ruminantium TaxID=1917441 RepID=UPI0012DF3547|nr:G5 domain-containing protein [Streptococcus ruminantium]